MNIGDIAERLIGAAEIERSAGHFNVGPGRGPGYIRAMALPYMHDWADVNGWGKERIKEDEQEYQDSVNKDPSPEQVSEAEEAVTWYSLVKDERERAALAAWVRCMAYSKRYHFQDWCKEAGIHRETGRRRKDRALFDILTQVSRNDAQHCQTGCSPMLHSGAEIGHVSDTVEDRVVSQSGITSWSDDEAFQPIYYTRTGRANEVETDGDFTWAKARNSRRKKRHPQPA